MRDVLAALGPAAPPAVAESALRVELANGSRVVSLPGQEQTIRGYSAPDLVLFDEAARADDRLYYAIRPMLATNPAARLILLSTPFGTQGFFHQRLAVVAAAEALTAAGGLEAPRAAVSALRRREAIADGGDGAAKLTPDERTALQAEVATLAADMRPLVARRDAALLVAGIAQAKAAAYGDDVRLRPDPRTESSPFETIAERVARQAA